MHGKLHAKNCQGSYGNPYCSYIKKWFVTQTNPQQHQNNWQKKLPSCHNDTWRNNNNNDDKKRQIEEPDKDNELEYDNNVNEKTSQQQYRTTMRRRKRKRMATTMMTTITTMMTTAPGDCCLIAHIMIWMSLPEKIKHPLEMTLVGRQKHPKQLNIWVVQQI